MGPKTKKAGSGEKKKKKKKAMTLPTSALKIPLT